MTTTQAPYQSANFVDYNPNPSSTTPTGTNVNTAGPHSSNIANSLDPRVDSQTGTTTTTTKTTRDISGAGPAGVAHGSSTGAAGMPGPGNDRAQYDPAVSGFNPSTGSGYAKSSGVGSQPTPSSGSYNRQDYRAEGQSQSAAKGEEVGRGVKSAIAGIHGAGESLRGALNAAVDKAFGHEEGAARNEAIANRGEQEIQTGNLCSQRGTR
ncbi:protein dprC [Aspergillus clavatus NRRL 1]|uniref:Uncharacterized protein n=1 Tax=Aspergillus clavatus (strain ATCC 1007 / CBS 513.65 / DSM 816 / NCTC 3887 / NRRL 1 / QM 1276 / 107) TaxID=344612 RepID=A1CDD8_ASPCL|nr:uncharacterized protein ACLA_006220 [Aspergillus clavatus NRRL 1]EAW11865.1 conserved hypothetical protein [Aspergillus clavatus NRRL 1]